MDAPKAPPRTIDQFCGKVCSCVRFSPDHAAISAELTGHMEEHRDALLEANPGMTLWDAESEAVRGMGDPEELGRWLNQIHNPRLGWFQIWFRRVVWTLAALVLLFALPQAKETITNLIAPASYDGIGMGHLLEHYDEYDVVADFTPGAVWQYEGYTFSIQRAVVTHSETSAYRDEALHLSYLLKVTHSDPWQRGRNSGSGCGQRTIWATAIPPKVSRSCTSCPPPPGIPPAIPPPSIPSPPTTICGWAASIRRQLPSLSTLTASERTPSL